MNGTDEILIHVIIELNWIDGTHLCMANLCDYENG